MPLRTVCTPFSVAVTICAVLAGNEIKMLAQSTQAAEVWARSVLPMRDMRDNAFDIRVARSRPGSSPQDEWSPVFKKLELNLKDIRTFTQVMDFMWLFHPLYRNDVYQVERSKELARRAGALESSTLDTWRAALEQVNKAQIGPLLASAFIATLDPIFSKGTLDAAAAARLLSRLKILPEGAVDELATLLGSGRMWPSRVDAALAIIREDRFFTQAGAFNERTFDAGIGALNNLIGAQNPKPVVESPPRTVSAYKFKIGDKVRLPATKQARAGEILWDEGMERFFNVVATIKKIDTSDQSVQVDVDSGKYWWALEWLAPDR
jgi:hypothetical protein